MLDVKQSAHSFNGIFDWQSYLDYVGNVSTLPKGRKAGGHSGLASQEDSQGSSFFGTENFSEAMKLAHEGWSEAAERARAISEPMFERVSSLIARHDMVYDVEGIGFDVARLLDGEPEHWVRWEETIVEGAGNRIVRIALNQTVSAGIETKVIEAKGAVASALVELFEYSGTRCEVWLVTSYIGNGYGSEEGRQKDTIQTRVLVKAADQNLDLPRVMFALAHPSSFRRLSFSFVERCSDSMWDSFKDGYGRVAELDGKEWDIYIPGSTYGQDDWTNPEKAREFVIKTLREQGVALNKEVIESEAQS